MNKSLPIPIVIAAASPEKANAWRAALGGHFALIREHPIEAPPSAPGGILVTDAASGVVGLPPLPGECVAEWRVVRIGTDGPADVCLPADFSPRELLTACRLLEQIVALRAELGASAKQHRRLAEQALCDPLTRLPNRRAWEESLTARLTAAHAERQLCLAIVDLDHFKAVNDQHGHLTGDDVLRVVGKSLRESIRHADLAARLGGDEFGLLLSLPESVDAGGVVERVRTRLAAAVADAGLPSVTASLGYCIIAGGAPPLPCPQASLATADAALRRAKEQGRNRSAAAHPAGR